VYFTYDAAGQRVRKVWEHSAIVEERIYVSGGYEIYRRREGVGLDLVLERETLHVMDDTRKIAMVETKTVDTSVAPFTPTPRVRYQLGNHLGSALLEVDEAGAVISYEEYHPYGTSAYRSGDSAVEVSARRYRYTGKERDEETGLYYHGARYYAPWLGTWTAADPAGMVDGPNLYQYVRGNPIRLRDPNGRQTADDQIAQMTDVQLHRHIAGLSAEGRAAFAGSATGMAAQRAWGTINRGGMEIGYSFPADGTTGTAPKDAPSHKAQSIVTAGGSPCPTCHGEYGAPLPRASVGDDPVLVAYGATALTVGAMLGDDSGTGPSADARRATVAAFDENPNSTSADAEALPTRVNPTAEAVLNVAAVKGPAVLAKSVGRGLEADAALVRSHAAGRSAGSLRSVAPGIWESRAGLRYGPGGAQGNRARHVLEHAADIPGRRGLHGVFAGGRKAVIATIDEAFVAAQAGGPGVTVVQRGARTMYTVDMGHTVGFIGGQTGASLGNPAATHMRLVLEGTSVITAFPVIP